MKKKILILGSFGHIGNALCNYLSSKNYQIIATYNKFIDKKKFHVLKKQNIKFIQCDLKNKSKLCIVSLWQLHSSSSDFRLLVLCEDVKTMLKKSILLRSHHIKYMMTLKEDNGDKIRKRRLDSRGWDHAVQIPVNARESFDEYHLHNNLNVTKIGPLRPPQSTTSTTYSKMWYSIILNSLVISTDLALIVQHPLKEKLSKVNLDN